MQMHWSTTDGPFAYVSWNAELPESFEAMHVACYYFSRGGSA